MKLTAGLILPFALTLVLTGAIRLGLGPDRGSRFAGAAVTAGFLLAWAFVWKPGWMPSEPFARIGHIALGAALAGLLVDGLIRRRFASIIAAVAVIAVSASASVTGVLWPRGLLTPGRIAMIAGVAAAGLLVIGRLDRLRGQNVVALVILAMLALTLAAVAEVAGDTPLSATAVMLSAAVMAYFIMGLAVTLPVGDSIVLGAGATALAIAWALAVRDPGARAALIVVPLILFADGTARRVPLPKARISALLFPLILAGIAALPLALAVVVAYVTTL